MSGEKIRRLKALKRRYEAANQVQPWIFLSDRGAPLTRSSVQKMLVKVGEKAGLPFRVHPHMLRHSTGYQLVNTGKDTRLIQDYLGHSAIRHTVRYTELDHGRFKGLRFGVGN